MSGARHDQAMGPQAVPALTGMHCGASLIDARDRLRTIFSQLLRKPGAAAALQQPIQAALQRVHARNVERFGWRDAEVIRAEAFAEAVETTVPQPEVIESDFGDLDGELQP